MDDTAQPSDQASATIHPPPAEPLARSEAEELADFTALVKERRRTLPEPTPEFRQVCESILAGIPPAKTPEQIVEEERRSYRAMLRQQQAEREARVQSLFAERGGRYATCTLGNYAAECDKQRAAVEKLECYAERLDERVKSGESIVIFGPAGTGKDHLLAAMMRLAVGSFGLSVRWENGMDLFGEIRDRMDAEQSEAALIRSLCHPDVLAISDPLPPFGPLTPFQANMLFRVIDGRYSRQKPTWVTLNCASGEEAESRMGVQMVDRLRHGALTIFANWPSYRKAK